MCSSNIKEHIVDKIETILESWEEVKGRVHSPSSENKRWIGSTGLKIHGLLDFITRNDD